MEILSPEDRLTRMQRKIKDFLEMGVAYVWVVNPEDRQGWIHTKSGVTEVIDGVFTGGEIQVNVAALD